MSNLHDEITKKHDEAMDFAEQAFVLQQKKKEGYVELFKKAFELEYSAFKQLEEVKDEDVKTTRSVILRSAMYCAKDANMLQEAKECAEKLLEITNFSDFKFEAKELLHELK